jgi:hypothetical protein
MSNNKSEQPNNEELVSEKVKDQYSGLSKEDLKALCTERGLSTDGKQKEMRSRLRDDDATKAAEAAAIAAASTTISETSTEVKKKKKKDKVAATTTEQAESSENTTIASVLDAPPPPPPSSSHDDSMSAATTVVEGEHPTITDVSTGANGDVKKKKKKDKTALSETSTSDVTSSETTIGNSSTTSAAAATSSSTIESTLATSVSESDTTTTTAPVVTEVLTETIAIKSEETSIKETASIPTPVAANAVSAPTTTTEKAKPAWMLKNAASGNATTASAAGASGGVLKSTSNNASVSGGGVLKTTPNTVGGVAAAGGGAPSKVVPSWQQKAAERAAEAAKLAEKDKSSSEEKQGGTSSVGPSSVPSSAAGSRRGSDSTPAGAVPSSSSTGSSSSSAPKKWGTPGATSSSTSSTASKPGSSSSAPLASKSGATSTSSSSSSASTSSGGLSWKEKLAAKNASTSSSTSSTVDTKSVETTTPSSNTASVRGGGGGGGVGGRNAPPPPPKKNFSATNGETENEESKETTGAETITNDVIAAESIDSKTSSETVEKDSTVKSISSEKTSVVVGSTTNDVTAGTVSSRKSSATPLVSAAAAAALVVGIPSTPSTAPPVMWATSTISTKGATDIGLELGSINVGDAVWIADTANGYVPAVAAAVSTQSVDFRILPTGSEKQAPVDAKALSEFPLLCLKKAVAVTTKAPTPAPAPVSKFGAGSKFGQKTSVATPTDVLPSPIIDPAPLPTILSRSSYELFSSLAENKGDFTSSSVTKLPITESSVLASLKQSLVASCGTVCVTRDAESHATAVSRLYSSMLSNSSSTLVSFGTSDTTGAAGGDSFAENIAALLEKCSEKVRVGAKQALFALSPFISRPALFAITSLTAQLSSNVLDSSLSSTTGLKVSLLILDLDPIELFSSTSDPITAVKAASEKSALKEGEGDASSWEEVVAGLELLGTPSTEIESIFSALLAIQKLSSTSTTENSNLILEATTQIGLVNQESLIQTFSSSVSAPKRVAFSLFLSVLSTVLSRVNASLASLVEESRQIKTTTAISEKNMVSSIITVIDVPTFGVNNSNLSQNASTDVLISHLCNRALSLVPSGLEGDRIHSFLVKAGETATKALKTIKEVSETRTESVIVNHAFGTVTYPASSTSSEGDESLEDINILSTSIISHLNLTRSLHILEKKDVSTVSSVLDFFSKNLESNNTVFYILRCPHDDSQLTLSSLRSSGVLFALQTMKRGYTNSVKAFSFMKKFYSFVEDLQVRKKIVRLTPSDVFIGTELYSTMSVSIFEFSKASSTRTSWSLAATPASIAAKKLLELCPTSESIYLVAKCGDVLFKPAVYIALENLLRQKQIEAASKILARFRMYTMMKRYNKYFHAVKALQGYFRCRKLRRAYIKNRDTVRKRKAFLKLSDELTSHAQRLALANVQAGTNFGGILATEERYQRLMEIAGLKYHPAALAVANTPGGSEDEGFTAVAAYSQAVDAVVAAVRAMEERKALEVAERKTCNEVLTVNCGVLLESIKFGLANSLVLLVDIRPAVASLGPTHENVHMILLGIEPPVVTSPTSLSSSSSSSVPSTPISSTSTSIIDSKASSKDSKPTAHLLSREALSALLRAISAVGEAIATLASPDLEKYPTTVAAVKSSSIRAHRVMQLEKVRRGCIASNKTQAEVALNGVITALNNVRESAGAAGVVTWPTVTLTIDSAAQSIASASLRINSIASSLFAREDLTLAIVDSESAAKKFSSDVFEKTEKSDESEAEILQRLEHTVSEGVLAQYMEGVDAAMQAVQTASAEIEIQKEVNEKEADAYANSVADTTASAQLLRTLWAEILAADAIGRPVGSAQTVPPPVPSLEQASSGPNLQDVQNALSYILAVQVRETMAKAASAVITAQAAIRTAASQRTRSRPPLGNNTSTQPGPHSVFVTSPSKTTISSVPTPNSFAVSGGVDIDLLRSSTASAVSSTQELQSAVRGELKRRSTELQRRKEALADLAKAVESLSLSLASAQTSGISNAPSLSSSYERVSAQVQNARLLLSSPDPFCDTGMAVAEATAAGRAAIAFSELVRGEEARYSELNSALTDAKRQMSLLLERFSRVTGAVAAIEDVRKKDLVTLQATLKDTRRVLRIGVRHILGSVEHPSLVESDLSIVEDSAPIVLGEVLAIEAVVRESTAVVVTAEEAVSKVRSLQLAKESAGARGLQAVGLASTRVEAVRTSAELLNLSSVVADHLADANASLRAIIPFLSPVNKSTDVNSSKHYETYLDCDPIVITERVDLAISKVTSAELFLDSLRAQQLEAEKHQREVAEAMRMRKKQDEEAAALNVRVSNAERTRLLIASDGIQQRLTTVLKEREVHSLRDCAALRRAVAAAEASGEAAAERCVSADPLVAAAAVNAFDSHVAQCEELTKGIVSGRLNAMERISVVKEGYKAIESCDKRFNELLQLANDTGAAVAAARYVSADSSLGDVDAVLPPASGAAMVEAASASLRVIQVPSFISLSADIASLDPTALYEPPSSSPTAASAGVSVDGYSSQRDVVGRVPTDEERSFCYDLVVDMLGEHPGGSTLPKPPVSTAKADLTGQNAALYSPSPHNTSSTIIPDDVVLSASEVAAAIAKANLALPPVGSRIDAQDRARAIAEALADAKDRKRTLLRAARHLPQNAAINFMKGAETAAAKAAVETATTGKAVSLSSFPVPAVVKHFIGLALDAVAIAKRRLSEQVGTLERYDAVLGVGLGNEIKILRDLVLSVNGPDAVGSTVSASIAAAAATASNDENQQQDKLGLYDVDAVAPSGFSVTELSRAVGAATSAVESAWTTAAHIKKQAEDRSKQVWAIRREKMAAAKAFDVLTAVDTRLKSLKGEVTRSEKTNELLPTSAELTNTAYIAAEDAGVLARAQVLSLSDSGNAAVIEVKRSAAAVSSSTQEDNDDVVIDALKRAVRAYSDAQRNARKVYESELHSSLQLQQNYRQQRSAEPHTLSGPSVLDTKLLGSPLQQSISSPRNDSDSEIIVPRSTTPPMSELASSLNQGTASAVTLAAAAVVSNSAVSTVPHSLPPSFSAPQPLTAGNLSLNALQSSVYQHLLSTIVPSPASRNPTSLLISPSNLSSSLNNSNSMRRQSNSGKKIISVPISATSRRAVSPSVLSKDEDAGAKVLREISKSATVASFSGPFSPEASSIGTKNQIGQGTGSESLSMTSLFQGQVSSGRLSSASSSLRSPYGGGGSRLLLQTLSPAPLRPPVLVKSTTEVTEADSSRSWSQNLRGGGGSSVPVSSPAQRRARAAAVAAMQSASSPRRFG